MFFRFVVFSASGLMIYFYQHPFTELLITYNQIIKMKKSSRNWTTQEDKMLQTIMMQLNADRKLKWQQVAELMHQKISPCQKTGKQCRQRWHNHLTPELNNSGEWTEEQNRVLFMHHGQLGNKWAKIATYLKGRTDNCVKNHFYSTLRRGMRKVNNYIHDEKKKKGSIKEFKPDVLNKILIVADGDPEQKLNAKNNAEQLSKDIKELLIKVSLEEEEQNVYDSEVMEKIVELVMEFNKNCKKRKGKKKGPAHDKNAINVTNNKDEESELSQLENQSMREEQSQVIKIESLEADIFKNIRKQKQSAKENKGKNGRNEQRKNIETSKLKEKTSTKAIIEDKNLVKQQQKDEVKSVEYNGQPPIMQKQLQIFRNIQGTRKISRAGSLEGYFPFNGQEMEGNFPFPTPNQKIEGAQQMFRSSGFALFTSVNQQNMVSKDILADSAHAFKKNSVLFNFSALSNGDDRNSFFNFDGDRGTLDPEELRNRGDVEIRQGLFDGLKFRSSAHSQQNLSASIFSKSEARNSGIKVFEDKANREEQINRK